MGLEIWIPSAIIARRHKHCNIATCYHFVPTWILWLNWRIGISLCTSRHITRSTLFSCHTAAVLFRCHTHACNGLYCKTVVIYSTYSVAILIFTLCLLVVYITFVLCSGSSVSLVTELRTGQMGPDSLGKGREFFSSPPRPDRLGDPPSLLSNEYRELSPGLKRSEREPDHPRPYSTSSWRGA
jgi:hypothetical protein